MITQSPGTGRKMCLSPRGRARRMPSHASARMSETPPGTTPGDDALAAPRCRPSHHLLLERHPAMMLLLRRDVGPHISRSGAAHGESGVSGLPCESFLGRNLLVNPA